jgi:predicted dinucleotide-binding enzyme
MEKSRIGILGAGKLGLALAKLGAEAGYEVWIASRKPAEKNALAVEILAPGAKVTNVEELLAEMPIILLAIPLSNYPSISKEQLAGKLVIDAMNYWWEVDGKDAIYSTIEESSSERVQHYLHESNVIKAFNHMGYHDLEAEARPHGAPNRKAIAIAGDDAQAVDQAAKIVDDFGFDPVVIGGLAAGRILEPGSELFGANQTKANLLSLIERIQGEQRSTPSTAKIESAT